MRINLIKAKTVLIKSGLPAADWVINPYNGCLFGCMYCYAAQIGRFKHPNEEWGSYLDVKINAPELLKIELEKLYKKFNKKDFGSIFFSSVTDPYLGLEAKYQLTRKSLKILVYFGYQGKISILTKSPLLMRDIDLFKKFKNIEIGMTITSLNDKICRFLEVKAPPVSLRLKALEKLAKEKILTYAFVGPILPYFVDNEIELKKIIDKLEEIGVKKIWFEQINLSKKIKQRLFNYLKIHSPNLIPYFEKTKTNNYQQKLNKIIYRLMKRRKIKMAFNKIIKHK
ncbi:MAG: radical SAM protein [Candidatus Microgenomates bacterium]